jgi:hypothetical protein
MVHCFLDDSGKEGQETNPYVCMAGYAMTSATVQDLADKWVPLLNKHQISEVHMRNLIPLSGPYKSLGWDIEKRDAVLADFIEVVRKLPMLGVGVAVDMEAWRSFKAAYPELDMRGAQQFCLERVLRRIVDRLHEVGVRDELALVFDTDPEFGSNRFRIFSDLLGHDRRAAERLTSITFGRPEWYPGLQCADMLVWETRKELIQRAGGHKSTRRWDATFADMPDYKLDYIGELWDAEAFNQALPQLISATDDRRRSAQTT